MYIFVLSVLATAVNKLEEVNLADTFITDQQLIHILKQVLSKTVVSEIGVSQRGVSKIFVSLEQLSLKYLSLKYVSLTQFFKNA